MLLAKDFNHLSSPNKCGLCFQNSAPIMSTCKCCTFVWVFVTILVLGCCCSSVALASGVDSGLLFISSSSCCSVSDDDSSALFFPDESDAGDCAVVSPDALEGEMLMVDSVVI